MVVVVPEFPFERLLGLSILVYSLASLRGFNPVMQATNNHAIGLALGLLNSVLTGMTGSMSVPGVMYLRSLQLTKDDFSARWVFCFSPQRSRWVVSLVV
jgi:hypothetical protein